MFWWFVFCGEPSDAMYGDLDVYVVLTSEAHSVSVRNGDGASVVIFCGHTFEWFPR